MARADSARWWSSVGHVAAPGLATFDGRRLGADGSQRFGEGLGCVVGEVRCANRGELLLGGGLPAEVAFAAVGCRPEAPVKLGLQLPAGR